MPHRPDDLAGPAAFLCNTLYVVGGMYGNPYALDAVLARASAEPSPPEIVLSSLAAVVAVEASTAVLDLPETLGQRCG